MTGPASGLETIRRALRPPCPVLDIHTHPIPGFGPYRVESPAEDAERLAAAAARSGVTRICISSLHATCPRDPTVSQFRQANDYVLRLRDARPEVFLPFCYVSPSYPGASVAEIERCVRGQHLVGVKLWVARRACDPGADPIVACAAELGVPVLQHAWRKTVGHLEGESYPADVAALAGRHPRARIIMAHLKGVNAHGVEDVARCPNVSVDTAGGDPEAGVVEWAVERLGRDRVLYGSDAPIRHFGVAMATVTGTGLPSDVQRDILWNNAARLLPPWADVAPLAAETTSG